MLGCFDHKGSMLWTYARDMKSWFQTVQEPIEENYKDGPQRKPATNKKQYKRMVGKLDAGLF